MSVAPRSVVIRPLRNSDIVAVASLYNRTFEGMEPLYSYPLSVSTFREKVLQHPDYSPGGSLVALDDGNIVGYGLAGARTHAVSEKDNLHGASIVLLMVAPERQRQGIGSALLQKLVKFARSHNRTVLTDHANPASPFSFFNGCQEDWRVARAFFEKHGFVETEVSCTCRQQLEGFKVKSTLADRLEEMSREGITVGPCGESHAESLVAAADSHYFYWGLDCRSKVERLSFPFLETAFMSLERDSIFGPDDVIVARKDDEVLAFVVMARNPGGEIAFLGPMWTHHEHQRKGYGSSVLQVALQREKEIHGTKVVDLWCSEHNANNFYARNGFETVGRWHEHELRLD